MDVQVDTTKLTVSTQSMPNGQLHSTTVDILHLVGDDSADLTRMPYSRLKRVLYDDVRREHPLSQMIQEHHELESPSPRLVKQINDYFHPTDGWNAYLSAMRDQAVRTFMHSTIQNSPADQRVIIRDAHLTAWHGLRGERTAQELWDEIMAPLSEEDRKAYEAYGKLYELGRVSHPQAINYTINL